MEDRDMPQGKKGDEFEGPSMDIFICDEANPEALYKEFPEQKGWPWWHSVLLWFKKPYHGIDQVGNKFYRVTAKYLFGKVYIVDAQEWNDNREMMVTPEFKKKTPRPG